MFPTLTFHSTLRAKAQPHQEEPRMWSERMQDLILQGAQSLSQGHWNWLRRQKALCSNNLAAGKARVLLWLFLHNWCTTPVTQREMGLWTVFPERKATNLSKMGLEKELLGCWKTPFQGFITLGLHVKQEFRHWKIGWLHVLVPKWRYS